MGKGRWMVVGIVVAAVAVAGCGDDDEGGSEEAAAPAEQSCDRDELTLATEGRLTVATGEPAFEPWVAEDDPTSGEGFESALVYALAEDLGFAEDDVEWVRTGFDEAIAPGDKEWDFNVQQYSITDERKAVVDFSDGYYDVEQAVVARAGSPVADAESLSDLAETRLGAAIGTTSLDYVDQVIEPSSDAAVFDDNAAAKAGLDAEQIDGLVFDLPTAFFITAVEIPDAEIVGVLPRIGDTPEQLGALFEKGSPLVACVNASLGRLRESGTLDQLEDTWLTQSGGIPTLSE